MKSTTVKCKNCKKKIMPQSNGIYHFCDSDCKIAWLKTDEGKKKMTITSKILEKERDKARIESVKSLSELESEARRTFQLWVRMRDNGLPCISCGATETTEWQGSHFYSADMYSGLIFNENNCHKSCEQCNKFKHGNLLEYRKGLIKRYGIKYVEELELLSNINRRRKYTKEELKEIREEYKFKIKELKKYNSIN